MLLLHAGIVQVQFRIMKNETVPPSSNMSNKKKYGKYGIREHDDEEIEYISMYVRMASNKTIAV